MTLKARVGQEGKATAAGKYHLWVPILRLFASARDAAGTARDTFDGATVAEVLDEAMTRYGDPFVAVLRISKVWVNGEPADGADVVAPTDEVAVLPPVSGGAR